MSSDIGFSHSGIETLKDLIIEASSGDVYRAAKLAGANLNGLPPDQKLSVAKTLTTLFSEKGGIGLGEYVRQATFQVPYAEQLNYAQWVLNEVATDPREVHELADRLALAIDTDLIIPFATQTLKDASDGYGNTVSLATMLLSRISTTSEISDRELSAFCKETADFLQNSGVTSEDLKRFKTNAEEIRHSFLKTQNDRVLRDQAKFADDKVWPDGNKDLDTALYEVLSNYANKNGYVLRVNSSAETHGDEDTYQKRNPQDGYDLIAPTGLPMFVWSTKSHVYIRQLSTGHGENSIYFSDDAAMSHCNMEHFLDKSLIAAGLKEQPAVKEPPFEPLF